jgi:hypothetical protein
MAADQTYDAKIFMLSMVLSSLFVYNSMGSIDEPSLERLSLVINLMNKDGDAGGGGSADIAPQLLWLIRDCSLATVDGKGREITPDQYLEMNLDPAAKGTGFDLGKDKQRTRKAVTGFFTGEKRGCYTLPCPSMDTAVSVFVVVLPTRDSLSSFSD